MKKNLFFQLSMLTISLIMVCSCSQGTDYTNAIPNDALSVVSINLKALAPKAGVNKENSKETIQKLTDALRSGMDAQAYEQLKTIIEDPSQSGIDIESPLYFFTSPQFPTGIVAKVNDESRLVALLQLTEQEGLTRPITEDEGCRITTFISGSTVLAFNASTLIITDGNFRNMQQIKADIIAALNQTPEQSITTNENFQRMQDTQGDIDIYATPAALPEQYTALFLKQLPQNIDLKSMAFVGEINFENGKVEFQAESHTTSPELQAFYEQQSKLMRPIHNKFLKYFPKSTLALFSMGLDGEAIYDFLQANPEFQQQMTLKQANQLKSILGLFREEATIGLINVTLTNMPTFLAYAGTEDNKMLDNLYAHKEELGLGWNTDIIRLNEQDYVFKSPQLSIFFGIKDNMLYATNDELLYHNIGKASAPDATENDYASEIKGKQIGCIINAEAICELPVIRMLAQFGGPEAQTYLELCEKIAYLKAVNKGNTSTVTIQLKDTDNNALKQLVDALKSMSGI